MMELELSAIYEEESEISSQSEDEEKKEDLSKPKNHEANTKKRVYFESSDDEIDSSNFIEVIQNVGTFEVMEELPA